MKSSAYDDAGSLQDNPGGRPKKHASAADRQAAYRARGVPIEFRADDATAGKLIEIAAALDVSRAELLLSMVKFALTNHDWARFGLTHKTIPRYQGNPMATRAQMAARKRFAEMAKSGALAKKRKAASKTATRKRNPSSGARYEMRRPDGSLDSVYSSLAHGKSALDVLAESGIVRTLTDTETGKVYHSFRETTQRMKRGTNPAAKKRPAVRAAPRDFYYVVKLVGGAYDGQFSSAHYTLADVQKIAQAKADKYGQQARITELHV